MKPTLEEHAVAEAQRQARNAEAGPTPITLAEVERLFGAGYARGLEELLEPTDRLLIVEVAPPPTELIDPAGYLGVSVGNMADDPTVIRACRDSLAGAWEAEKARADAADLETTLLRAELADARAWAGRWKKDAKSLRREFWELAAVVDKARWSYRASLALREAALREAERALAYVVEKMAIPVDMKEPLRAALKSVRGALGKGN